MLCRLQMTKLLFLVLFPYSILAQMPSDTLTIGKNQIVFFSISKAEYDSLSSLEDSEGLEEVIGDFNYYSRKVITTYKDSLHIETKFTVANYFKIQTESKDTLIRKTDLSHLVGFLANNGKEFIVEEGVFSSAGFMDFIRRNFHFNKK
jgi:hypothetical protein